MNVSDIIVMGYLKSLPMTHYLKLKNKIYNNRNKGKISTKIRT